MWNSLHSLHNLANLASAQTVAAILPPTIATTHSTDAVSHPSVNPPTVADYDYITLTPPPLSVATTPRTGAATVTPPLTVATTHRTITASPPSTTPHIVAVDDAMSYDLDYVASGNSKNVLLAMAMGLLDDKVNLLFDPINNPVWKQCKAWKDLKPKKTLLRDEVLRRKKAPYSGEGDCKVPHAQKTKLIHEQLLHSNTHMSDTNKDFVVRNFNRLLKNVTDAAGPTENDPDKLIQFRGMHWILRMIHCLVENDDARIAFSKVYDSLDRRQLDGRKNPETARVSAWEIIAKHFNDPDFNPRSSSYPLLHEAFSQTMCLSHSIVVKHGPIDARKVKNKFLEMKYKLTIIKTNHRASGMGEGSLNHDEIVPGSELGTIPSVGSFDDCSNFLRSERPTLLYLWVKSNEFDLLDTVLQKLGGDVALEDTVTSGLTL